MPIDENELYTQGGGLLDRPVFKKQPVRQQRQAQQMSFEEFLPRFFPDAPLNDEDFFKDAHNAWLKTVSPSTNAKEISKVRDNANFTKYGIYDVQTYMDTMATIRSGDDPLAKQEAVEPEQDDSLFTTTVKSIGTGFLRSFSDMPRLIGEYGNVESANMAAEWIDSIGPELDPDHREKFLPMVGQGIGQVASLILMGAMTGGAGWAAALKGAASVGGSAKLGAKVLPYLSVGASGGVEGLERYYEHAEEQGIPINEGDKAVATLASSGIGMLDMIFPSALLAKAIKPGKIATTIANAARGGLIKRASAGAIIEGGTEALQAYGTSSIVPLMYGADPNMAEAMLQIKDEGLVGGTVGIIINSLIGKRAPRLRNKDIDQKEVDKKKEQFVEEANAFEERFGVSETDITPVLENQQTDSMTAETVNAVREISTKARNYDAETNKLLEGIELGDSTDLIPALRKIHMDEGPAGVIKALQPKGKTSVVKIGGKRLTRDKRKEIAARYNPLVAAEQLKGVQVLNHNLAMEDGTTTGQLVAKLRDKADTVYAGLPESHANDIATAPTLKQQIERLRDKAKLKDLEPHADRLNEYADHLEASIVKEDDVDTILAEEPVVEETIEETVEEGATVDPGVRAQPAESLTPEQILAEIDARQGRVAPVVEPEPEVVPEGTTVTRVQPRVPVAEAQTAPVYTPPVGTVRKYQKARTATAENPADVYTELRESFGEKRLQSVFDTGLVEVITVEQAIELLGDTDGRLAQGFTAPDGTTFLVQGAVEAGDAVRTISHELGVHAKRLGFRDSVQFQGILNLIDRRASEDSADGRAIRAAQKAVPKDTPAEYVGEETLAYLVTKSPDISVVRRFIAAIKKFLVERLGVNNKMLTNLDIQALALSAARSTGTWSVNAQDTMYQGMGGQTNTKAFKDWFGDSKVVDENGNPLVVYHGTKRDFTEFKARYEDSLLFFTVNPEFAGNWPKGTGGLREATAETKALADEAYQYEKKLGTELFPEGFSKREINDEWHREYNAIRAEIASRVFDKYGFEKSFEIESDADINIMPVFLSVQNPFDPRTDYKKIEPVLREMESMEGVIEAENHKAGNWVVYENKTVIDAIKGMGYDGIYLAENIGGPHETIAAFEPTQIKSATGNIGTFDPNNPDIRYQKRETATDPENTYYPENQEVPMHKKIKESQSIKYAGNQLKRLVDGGLSVTGKDGRTLKELAYESKRMHEAAMLFGDQSRTRVEGAIARFLGDKSYNRKNANAGVQLLFNNAISGDQDALAEIRARDEVSADAIVRARKDIDEQSFELRGRISEHIQYLEDNNLIDFDRNGYGTSVANYERLIDLEEIIAKNKGNYLNKSYQATHPTYRATMAMDHYSGKWRKAEDRFTERLEQDGWSGEYDTARAAARGIMTDLYNGYQNDSIDAVAFGSNRNLYERQQIVPEIAEWLGEVTDPVERTNQSMRQIQFAIAKYDSLKTMRDIGMDLFVADPRGELPGDYVPADDPNAKKVLSSGILNPMTGMYMQRDVANGLKDQIRNPASNFLMSGWYKMNSIAKINAVALNPTSFPKAFWGNMLFWLHNGAWNPAGDTRTLMEEDINSMGREAWERQMTKDGLKGTSLISGDVMMWLDDFMGGVGYVAEPTKPVAKQLGNAFHAYQKVTNKIVGGYQAVDNAFKVRGFYANYKAIKEMKDGKWSDEKMRKWAQDRTLNGFQDYSQVPLWARKASRIPVMNSFASFTAEAMRIAQNSAMDIATDLKDPDLKAHAMRRLAGTATAYATTLAVANGIWGMLGEGDEELEDQIKGETWKKGHIGFMTGTNNDMFVDFHYIVPNAFMVRPVLAAAKWATGKTDTGEFAGDLFDTVADELWGNILTETISDATKQALREKDFGAFDTGEVVANVFGEALKEVGKRVIIPKAVEYGDKIIAGIDGRAEGLIVERGLPYDAGEELLKAVGWNMYPTTKHAAATSKAYILRQRKQAAKKIIQNIMTDMDKMTPKALIDAINDAQAMWDDAHTEFMESAEIFKRHMTADEFHQAIFNYNPEVGDKPNSIIPKKDFAKLEKGEIPSIRMDSTKILRDAAQRAIGKAATDRLLALELRTKFKKREKQAEQLLREYGIREK